MAATQTPVAFQHEKPASFRRSQETRKGACTFDAPMSFGMYRENRHGHCRIDEDFEVLEDGTCAQFNIGQSNMSGHSQIQKPNVIRSTHCRSVNLLCLGSKVVLTTNLSSLPYRDLRSLEGFALGQGEKSRILVMGGSFLLTKDWREVEDFGFAIFEPRIQVSVRGSEWNSATRSSF